MEDTIYIIIRFCPPCANRFTEYIHTNYPNLEDDDEIVSYIHNQAGNILMRNNGCIVSIEDNEISVEEVDLVNNLLRDETENYIKFVQNCGQQGGKKSKKSKKSKGKKRKKTAKKTAKKTSSRRKKHKNSKKHAK